MVRSVKWFPLLLSVCALLGLALGTIQCSSGNPPNSDKTGLEDQAKIDVAVKNQQAGNYKPDAWECRWLRQGDLIYSGLPGQTEYYTTRQTVDASGKSAPRLWESLQVAPHIVFGYRTEVMEYQVQTDIRVPYGKCQANPQYGDGGGEQFFIADFKTALKATNETTKLTDGGSDNLAKINDKIKQVVGIK